MQYTVCPLSSATQAPLPLSVILTLFYFWSSDHSVNVHVFIQLPSVLCSVGKCSHLFLINLNNVFMVFSFRYSKSKFFHVITSHGLHNYHCNCTKCSGGCIGCFAVWRTELPLPLPLPARGRSEMCSWTSWRTTLTGHRLYEGSFETSSSQNSEFRLNGKISRGALVFKWSKLMVTKE